MFAVLHPETATPNAFFIFHFIDRITAMRNLFYQQNRKEYTQKQCHCRFLSFLLFILQISKKHTFITNI